jgi:hypothetical protein
MSHLGRETAPFTLAGQPMDEWDRIQFHARLNRRAQERRELHRNAEAHGAIGVNPEDIALSGIIEARTRASSESDELYAEGDQ